MRVFVARASGAIGSRLVPQLIERGHEVIGTHRSPGNRELGGEPIALDVLDARAVRAAVLETEPDAIVHQATALADLSDFKHFDRSSAQTNRLRTEGTDALLAAAREAGVRRFVAQSYARCRAPASASGRPSARASTGPRSLKSTAPASRCRTSAASPVTAPQMRRNRPSA